MIASLYRASALAPLQSRHPLSTMRRETASFSGASAWPPLHRRHLLMATQHETAAFVEVSPRIFHRHLPMTVLPLASLPGLPVRSTYDQGHEEVRFA